MEKVPKGLPLKDYYARILNWHRKNKNGIFVKLSHKEKNDPYICCYLELNEALPQAKSVAMGDVAFVCREVIGGLMEWAYHEKDEDGVKTAAYAQHVLDTFFDGFSSEKTIQNAKASKLFAEHNMSACLKRYQSQA